MDHVPGLAAIRARREQAAAEALACVRVHRGLPYATGADPTLDIFPAEGAKGPVTVQFFIHGGFWQSLRPSPSWPIALPSIALAFPATS